MIEERFTCVYRIASNSNRNNQNHSNPNQFRIRLLPYLLAHSRRHIETTKVSARVVHRRKTGATVSRDHPPVHLLIHITIRH